MERSTIAFSEINQIVERINYEIKFYYFAA